MNAVPDRHTVLAGLSASESGDLHDDVSMIAQLAFGKAQRADAADGARHLALLNRETLELDLSDPEQRHFGDYELLELIGEGGMGVVYRARQHSLDREVAVKLLAAGPWASAQFVERFRREAQNAARMQHPNIVAIYEVGDNEELHFFSMRLIGGPSLAAEVRRQGRLQPLRAAQLLRTIAEAVDYAHRLGVLHLDLKPANVLIDENGTPHVADFGLARRLEQMPAENTEVSGTPSYMAPEQATAGAQKITPATDIWGLGAILYELVTGEPPFLGNSAQATLRLVVEGTLASPRDKVPGLPRDLEAVILRCMARDQAGRYATARELAEDLTRFIENREVRARPLSAPQRIWRWARREPRLAIAASLAFVALLTGLGATTQQWRRADANAQHAGEQKQLAEERLWEGRRDWAMRLMQDGKGFDALVPLLANIDEQARAGKDDQRSIERRELGMIENLGVTLIDRLIVPDANPMAAALSPDGSLLAISLNDISVRWYDTATLTERGRVDLSDLPTTNETYGVPILLNFIGDHLLRVTDEWLTMTPSPGYGNSFLVDLDKRSVIEPPAAFANLAEAVFTADGRHALLRNRRDEVQVWQVDPWRPLSPLRADRPGTTNSYWLLDVEMRHAFRFGATGTLDVLDPRRLADPKPLLLPPHESFTAWKQSGDGSWLALGTANGQVFVLDMQTLQARLLPSPTGGEVSWISFSEDSAWVVAARRDGAAFAFDVASNEPLHSGQMQHDFELTRVEINRRNRLVLVSGAGESMLWRLPVEGPGARDPVRLFASPTRSARAGVYWTSMSLPKGLLATADMDGEVRLWRLPRPFDQAGRPSSLRSAALYFDGRHVAEARHDRIRVLSIPDGTATPWLALPAPVAFTQLLAGGKKLLTVARNNLRMLDAGNLHPVLPDVPLRGTPLQLAADADATVAALAFPHNGEDGFEERIEIRELATGRRRDGEIAVRAPLRQLELSSDASRLLATGPPDGAIDVFDTRTLARLGSMPNDPTRPVLWAAFDSDPATLWLVARDLDDTLADNAELIHWDGDSGRVLERRRIPGIRPVGVTVVDGKPLLAAADRLVLDPGTPDQKVAAGLHGGEATTLFATSPDGRLVANAYGWQIGIYDAHTLQRVGPLLNTGLPLVGGVQRIAFASDGRSLLASESAGRPRWSLWQLAPDERPVAGLHEALDLLVPHAAGPRILRVADAAERMRLRRSDPGDWRVVDAGPPEPVARRILGEPVPLRDPDADPMLLDLAQVYNGAPTSTNSLMNSVMPWIGQVPIGIARIDGVDYDLRGSLELRGGAGGSIGSRYALPLDWHATGIAVPARPIAAFHILLNAPSSTPTDRERLYAKVRVHYRDGSEAVLPIRTQVEVPGWTDHDRVVPLAWAVNDLNVIGLTRQQLISNPRLPNPHPERLIATLDLETASEGWSTPVFFAITAEPVIADASRRTDYSRNVAHEPAAAAGNTTERRN